jgi:hypothetical protein
MIVYKVYFQPGRGRKETALMRGYGETRDRKLFEEIINLLLSKGVLRNKGDEGRVYHPDRKLSA